MRIKRLLTIQDVRFAAEAAHRKLIANIPPGTSCCIAYDQEFIQLPPEFVTRLAKNTKLEVHVLLRRKRARR